MRKLIVQTPGRKKKTKEKTKDLGQVNGQAIFQWTLGRNLLAQTVEAELTEQCVSHQTDVSLVDGLLTSNSRSLPPCTICTEAFTA